MRKIFYIKISIFTYIFMYTIIFISFINQTIITHSDQPIYFISIDTLNHFNTQTQTKKSSNISPQTFSNILDELYKNNFILINISDIYTTQNNTLKLTSPNIPSDKIPLVIFIENNSYTKSNFTDSTVDKLILDRNYEFATYSKRLSIQDRISHTLDAIPILESFIKKHPDFSYNNSKAVLGISGEQDILGYPTNPKNFSTTNNKERLLTIISTLKHRGYSFCSNNYSYTNINTIDDITFIKNISLWKTSIAPIIGDTNIIAFPYGIPPIDTSRYNILSNEKFNIFVSNSNTPSATIQNNNLFITKLHIDTNSLSNNPNTFRKLFDPNIILTK